MELLLKEPMAGQDSMGKPNGSGGVAVWIQEKSEGRHK